ncbi:hypothetical protein PENTCL1PPCAC_2386 [Pristionchus entomophagus]|uniref:Peroxisomal ATPase PEX1 n=1 Tax=Pristionchus entomophagus TaxID=358040 RepID=A0AAV5SKN0_9BILA|nr:hypothetical protein PENTCL1PPCAC_2386 [Pristionchus entomophagus]
MTFHISSPLLSYLLPLLLSKSNLLVVRRYIWKRKSITVYHRSPHHEYSVLFAHPLTLLHYGVFPGQICKVSFIVQKDTSRFLTIDRMMRIRPDFILPTQGASLSTHDIYNTFGAQPIISLSIKKIVPYSRLPDSIHLKLADRLKVATVIQPKTVSIDENGGIANLLETPRVVYNGDLVSITISNPLEGSKELVTYKLDCSPHSSCLVDSRVSVYETSSIHSPIPFGSSPSPLPILPLSINHILHELTKISYAHSQAPNGFPLSFLIHGPSGSGKRLLAHKFAAASHKNIIEVNSLDIWSDLSSQGEQKLKGVIQKAVSAHPGVLYISNVDALGYDAHTRNTDSRVISTLKNTLEDSSKAAQITVVLGCTTKQLSNVSQAVRELVLYEYSIPSLNPIDRFSYLRRLLKSEKLSSAVAKNTSGFVVAELIDLVTDSISTARENGRKMNAEDVEGAIERRNLCIASSVGSAKVPAVSWEDIGGLEDSKRILQESLAACLKGGKRTKRSGIILFGPPGCGKTLLAKAVATQYKIAFLSVKGPELLNKYVGQSEENLRNVFERAREASPCVIFFDELDSIAPNRGRHGDSGGVMDRIVSQLLSELDDLQSQEESQVFIMGATNRADLLDQALLSPGRFDKIINISPGQDVDSKKKILQAVSRSVQLAGDVDMEEVATSCPPVMSGAELYSIVSNATMAAIREQRFLEDFVTSLDSTTLDLRGNGCRFVHAVVVVADEKSGEVNQATLLRQLDAHEMEERSDEEPSLGPPTSLENADILRALKILEESQEYVASTPIPET